MEPKHRVAVACTGATRATEAHVDSHLLAPASRCTRRPRLQLRHRGRCLAVWWTAVPVVRSPLGDVTAAVQACTLAKMGRLPVVRALPVSFLCSRASCRRHTAVCRL